MRHRFIGAGHIHFHMIELRCDVTAIKLNQQSRSSKSASLLSYLVSEFAFERCFIVPPDVGQASQTAALAIKQCHRLLRCRNGSPIELSNIWIGRSMITLSASFGPITGMPFGLLSTAWSEWTF